MFFYLAVAMGIVKFCKHSPCISIQCSVVILTFCGFSTLNLRVTNGLAFFGSNPPPESHMSLPQLITHHGYSVETHTVVTEDLYVLTLFRIPHGKNEGRSSKEPVYLQHGVFCSANEWFLIPPDQILPYLLADRGHDVWIGGFRGSNYSMKHLNLSPDELKFWDFSFHENGIYDTVSFVNYILNVTGYSKLTFVGHSMAAAALITAIDKDPGFNDKFRKAVMLAPSVYLNHARSPFFIPLVLPNSNIMRKIALEVHNIWGRGRVIPAEINQLMKRYGPSFCASGVIQLELICKNYLFLFSGFNRAGISNETVINSAGHTPSDASSKTIAHYSQCIHADSFQKYDYGSRENLERYGTLNPPLYNLSLVAMPTLVMYGVNDYTVGEQDVLRVAKELRNVQETVEIPDKLWTHMDFLYSKYARTQVYDRVLKFIDD